MLESEHKTEGGEYEFFFNIYKESFSFPNIKLFSCLIGRKSDFNDLKRFLIEEEQRYETL